MTTDECIEWLEYQGNNRFNLYTTEFLECAARLRELEAENARLREQLGIVRVEHPEGGVEEFDASFDMSKAP